ncbi:hypothetical protein NMY22_g14716 [Coprinellus aureogranulatus]|nr:hypothetical protein NMY22_g14716 [Coprinellus aureogranulatus]
MTGARYTLTTFVERLSNLLPSWQAPLPPSSSSSSSVEASSSNTPRTDYILVPRIFASLFLSGLFPWEAVNAVAVKVKDVFVNCQISVGQPKEPFFVGRGEDGSLIARYEIELSCSAHPKGECPIPHTPLGFDVTFPPAAPGMEEVFATAASDAMQTCLLGAIQAHVGGGGLGLSI